MMPSHLMLCDPEYAKSREARNKFVPRVHPEDSGICGMVYTDEQLVRRCRSRRRGILTIENQVSFLRDLHCPSSSQISIDVALSQKISKYTERAESLQCQTSRGMWNQEMSDIHKCVLISVGHF